VTQVNALVPAYHDPISDLFSASLATSK